jgi:hypothetical protein
MQKQGEQTKSMMSESRILVESMFGFGWAMSLFGAKQMSDMLRMNIACAAKSFDKVSNAATQNLNQPSANVVSTSKKTQQSADAKLFTLNMQTAPKRKVHSGRLNKSVFVVLGEGLAAGVGDFTLHADTQRVSFPALMAQEMQTEFAQPLLQPPGIGNLVGFAEQSVLLPDLSQTTVLENLPPAQVQNLSVPCFCLKDSLGLHAQQPLIHRYDAKQTAANLIFGLMPIVRGDEKMPTQLEAAMAQQPTFTLIELGYYETLEAAVKSNTHLLPLSEDFHFDLSQLLAYLHQDGTEILLLTIPDPLDTAYFADLTTATKILKVEQAVLQQLFNIKEGDFITANGLNEISFQLFARTLEPLPSGSVLDSETAAHISACVRSLNAEIVALANEYRAQVFDLNALFNRVKTNGVTVGARKINAEYLGGFYSLNGYYPGATGHALIANELLHFLNQTYGADFGQIDLQSVSEADPVFAYKQAEGPVWTLQNLPPPQPKKQPQDEIGSESSQVSSPTSNQHSEHRQTNLPLQLPPNLEQTLPLNKDLSYFGDGIGAVNCLDARGIQWGDIGKSLFGGLAMVDSHLNGRIHIKFSPPENNLTRFEVSFLEGFAGEDAVLTTPRFFKMAFQQSRVDSVPNTISSGALNLATGEVSDLKIYARYSSTALFALVSVNPTFPKQPLMFPGQYGSAWARFEQREDGLLDFSFYGSTFVPLGKDILWPLNFVGPSGQFATIPSNGTVMHPHLSLSTKATPQDTHVCPDIPFDTVQEYTLFTHNSSFGDAFTLNIPQLGGKAKGRSHILGRALIQFGSRCGNSVPIAVTLSRMGGVMDELEASPIVDVFPGKLTAGAQGFDEFLRFPQRTYSLDDLAILSDPFDISVGAIDLRTGKMLNELLHRGFINQDLIFALMRVEPRTPKDSFFFRGPARVEKGKCGQSVFRFQGEVFVPYPPGFNFPQPNLTTSFVAGPNSRLDPFLWIQAIQEETTKSFVKEGSANKVMASVGELFSYRYRIPSDPTKESAYFEYENHTQRGSFKMHSLAWIDFCNSRSAGDSTGNFDTVSFTCFGVWTKDGVSSIQQASVQISTATDAPYVGIQIEGGAISNVNTKPEREETAIP